MRKNYALRPEGKHPDRVLDAVKHDIRRYMRRVRGQAVPADADFWDFDCRLGETAEAAQAVHPGELIKQLDSLAKTGASHCYVELLPRAAQRRYEAREPVAPAEDSPEATSPEADTDD